ncbi:MAG: polysaccharide biosynthesis tyrosine autokinase [Nocardioides sp.]|nr:polysaccharide biosynthesis tyrosine autokinase [Nocardioides sp.]
MDSDVINLRDQVGVVRRRWRVVVLCVLLGIGAAYALSQTQEPTYSASAEVLIAPSGDPGSRQSEVLTSEEIATQVEVITSEPVAAQVRSDLGISTDSQTLLDSVEVAPIEDTRVLTITATSGTAEDAADLANGFAVAYLSARELAESQQSKSKLESLQSRYADVRKQLQEVQARKTKTLNLSNTTLESQEQALTVQLTGLLGQLSEASALASGDPNSGQVLKQATPPAAPTGSRLLLVGGAFGVLLGLGLAFVRDHFDDAIRDESRLRTVLPKPVLGHIPHWGGSRRDRLVTLMDPQAPASEAYRSLSSSVRFLLAASRKNGAGREDQHRTLLVTSAEPGEGKTTVACNLAVTAARFGLRVILVDADLRRPTIAQYFGLGSPPGMTDMLSEGSDLDSYLVSVGPQNLQLLSGGSIPPNPAELLASDGARDALSDLRARADLVIIDSAPVSRVADTRELMPSADLVMVVVRHAVTRTRRLVDATERIRLAGGTVAGTVFNGVDTRDARNSYNYGDASAKKWRGRRTASRPPTQSALPASDRAPGQTPASTKGQVRAAEPPEEKLPETETTRQL